MTIIERMRAELRESMKAGDAFKTQFLRYWITQFSKSDGTELKDEEAIKKMRAVVNESKNGITTFEPLEIAEIKKWVPVSLDSDQVREILRTVDVQILDAKNDGQAMGVAMKCLKGMTVESEDVKSVVAAIRAAK